MVKFIKRILNWDDAYGLKFNLQTLGLYFLVLVVIVSLLFYIKYSLG